MTPSTHALVLGGGVWCPFLVFTFRPFGGGCRSLPQRAWDMQMQTLNAWVLLFVWRIAPQLGLGWTQAHAPIWF